MWGLTVILNLTALAFGRGQKDPAASAKADDKKNGGLETIKSLINKDAKAEDLPAYEDYLVLYRDEIRAIERSQQHAIATPNEEAAAAKTIVNQKELAARDYKGILRIVEVLLGAKSKCRGCVRDELRNCNEFKSSNDISLNNSIDMAFRLWLMLNVRRFDQTLTPDTISLQWNNDDTLAQFVNQQFPEVTEPMASNASHRIDADFTAVALREYRRIDVVWTTSLEDHLRLKYDRKKKKARLRVFPFKRILVDHLKYENTVYPKALLKEAIWTLDLLFPVGDAETTKFLLNEEEGNLGKHIHDITFWEPPPPGFFRYHYWKARLAELQDELHAPPQSLWRALKDGRNIIVWWTFWLAFAIAFMTLIFGIATLWLNALLLQDALKKS